MKTFREAWKAKEELGYRYGPDALNNVQFGFQIALDCARESIGKLPALPVPEGTIYGDHRSVKGHAYTAETVRNYTASAIIPYVAEVQRLKEVIDLLGRKAEAGLCYASVGSLRAFLEDVMNIAKKEEEDGHAEPPASAG